MFFYSMVMPVTERPVQVLCRISHKLLQIFCHLSLCLMSIYNALLHFKISAICIYNAQKDNDVWLKAKWMTLHFLDTMLQLNDAGCHLVDSLAMTLVGLSQILKWALSILASPARSLQSILRFTLEEAELVGWNGEQRKMEGEKKKMKKYVLK